MLYILILIFQISASGTHIVAKSVTQELHPAVLMFLRAFISTIIYAGWLLFNRKKIIKIDKGDWKKILLLGLLNIPLNQYLFLVAVKLTSAPNVSLAYAMTPAFVLILAVLFYNERASRLKVTGILLAILGASLILFERGFDFSSDSFWGFVIVLFAAFCYAWYTIIGREFSLKYGPLYSMSLTMIAGFLLYVPMFMFSGETLNLSQITMANWWEILYLGVVTSGLGYALWYIILTMTESSKASVTNNLQPVFTTLLSVMIFSTHITMTFIFGGLLIISGVFFTQRG